LENNIKIAVLGLGYVGLPVLIKLKKSFKCIGYDINQKRISQLKKGIDLNNTFSKKKLINTKLTNKINDIKHCNIFIICVPTPINKNKKPDLSNLKNACIEIAKVIKINDIVVFESTYSPFTTNVFCKNIIEKKSNLKAEKDFFLGYSPERINPGDKKNNIDKVTKIISANSDFALHKIKMIYKKITKKIFIAKSIEIAESAKIIENIQRDISIAFFNQLTEVFLKLKLNPNEIFKAAATKWNFIKLKPGLVGGHCIPVDPYYFYDFLKKKKINSNFILSGRNVNENYKKLIIKIINKKFSQNNYKKILFLGATYKENVPDFRNSKAIEIINFFKNKINCKVFDPYHPNNKFYIKFEIIKKFNNSNCLIIKLVDHDLFRSRKFKNLFIKKEIIDINDLEKIYKNYV
jgi:UDP-N-acetyl-D-galactosamine dehydrogenase